MQPGSLIGFAVVSICLCWTSSLILGLPAVLARPWLSRFGPWTERVVAASALSLPPLFSVAVTLLLIERSIVASSSGDHCLVHAHHPHLCLYHGGAWAQDVWAVATVTSFVLLLATRLAGRLRKIWRGLGAHRTLERVSRSIRLQDSVALIAPAASVFCFVTGVRRPRIVFSSAAWARLDDAERRAVLEHENAHVAHGDLWRRAVLGAVATLGAPFVASRLLQMWEGATERLCDSWSARKTGEPLAVASALVKLSRCRQGVDAALASSFVSAADVASRVEALLRDEPDGARAARRFGFASMSAAVAAVLVCAQSADTLHHALETLLALI